MGIGIPLARSIGPVDMYRIHEGYIGGDVLRPSTLIGRLSEHGLILTRRQRSEKFSTFVYSRLIFFSIENERASIIGSSPWKVKKNWEASIEVLKSRIGTKSHKFDGGTQKVLLSASDLTPVFQANHFVGIIRIYLVLMTISVYVLIGEILINCQCKSRC